MLNVNKRLALKIANWWMDDYPLMATEELGELIQAISKAERSDLKRKSRYTRNYQITDEDVRNNLIEELADVAIAIGVLSYRYDITDEELNKQISIKMHKKM